MKSTNPSQNSRKVSTLAQEKVESKKRIHRAVSEAGGERLGMGKDHDGKGNTHPRWVMAKAEGYLAKTRKAGNEKTSLRRGRNDGLECPKARGGDRETIHQLQVISKSRKREDG